MATSNNSHNRISSLAIVIVLLTGVVFIAFPSQQLHIDGAFQRSQFVSNGQFDPAARHIFFNTFATIYHRVWQLFGYRGDATLPLHLLNGVAGAFGALAVFTLLRQLVAERMLAFWLTLLFAFSYGYWTYTAELFYNIPAMLPLLWAVAYLFTVRVVSVRDAAILGGLMAVAVLSTQEHLVTTLAVGIGLLLRSDLKRLVVYGIVFGTLLVVGYGSAFLIFNDCYSVRCFVGWLRPYDQLLPMYQRIDWRTIPATLIAFLSAFVPIWRGLGLGALLRGSFSAENLLSQLAFALILLGLLIVSLRLWRQRKLLWQQNRTAVIVALSWLAINVPLILWFDAASYELWIVPLVPLLMLTGMTLDGWSNRWRVHGLAAVVVVMAAANFWNAIYPDSTQPNVALQQARAVSQALEPEDVIVTLWLDWTLYMDDAQVVSIPAMSVEMFGNQPDADALMDALDEKVSAVEAVGGEIYFVSSADYTPTQWNWIAQNTGIRPDHLERYQFETISPILQRIEVVQ